MACEFESHRGYHLLDWIIMNFALWIIAGISFVLFVISAIVVITNGYTMTKVQLAFGSIVFFISAVVFVATVGVISSNEDAERTLSFQDRCQEFGGTITSDVDGDYSVCIAGKIILVKEK
jgi:hypothetical protein